MDAVASHEHLDEDAKKVNPADSRRIRSLHLVPAVAIAVVLMLIFVSFHPVLAASGTDESGTDQAPPEESWWHKHWIAIVVAVVAIIAGGVGYLCATNVGVHWSPFFLIAN